jgi:hypothetical protein
MRMRMEMTRGVGEKSPRRKSTRVEARAATRPQTLTRAAVYPEGVFERIKTTMQVITIAMNPTPPDADQKEDHGKGSCPSDFLVVQGP